MASCKFLFNFNGDPNILYQRALSEAQKYGAKIDGGLEGGSFHITILGGNYRGSYQLQGSTIIVELYSKPLFIPCSLIESIVGNYLAK